MKKAVLAIGSIALAGSIFAGCGDGDITKPKDINNRAVVTITDYKFTVNGKVSAGKTFNVVNEGQATHTFTFDKNGSNAQIAPGKTGQYSQGAGGSYKFHCNIHPQMTGTLEVSTV